MSATFMVGQRVILTGQGGVKEIGVVVPPETGHVSLVDVWVFSPTNGYASNYSVINVRHLPNGQL